MKKQNKSSEDKTAIFPFGNADIASEDQVALVDIKPRINHVIDLCKITYAQKKFASLFDNTGGKNIEIEIKDKPVWQIKEILEAL